MRTARICVPGMAGVVAAAVHDEGARLVIGGRSVASAGVRFEPPCEGLVYGVILNDQDSLHAMGPQLHSAPYKSPPQAPVLYIKPYNTHVGHGSTVYLPDGVDRVQVCAALGIVFGGQATRVSEGSAMEAVRGFTAVADLTLPHDSLHRPPIREKCFDGSCPIGPWLVGREQVSDPDALEVLVRINGAVQQQRSLRGLVRGVSRLIADVTEFLTLYPGDVLLAGVPVQAPIARAGDAIAVDIPGIGQLEAHIAASAEGARR